MTTVEEAITILTTEEVVELSLDNDLYPFLTDGWEVCDWMLANNVWPGLVHVHTDNAEASRYMCGIIRKSGYTSLSGKNRSFRKKARPSKG